MQRWIFGSHVTAQLKTNTERCKSIAKEVSASRIKFDEESVQKCSDVIDTLTPIFKESDGIISISSGVNANQDVQKDLLAAKSIGDMKSAKFIRERIKDDDVPFYDPISKNNLKTFSSMNIKKSIKIKDESVLIKADRDFFGRMLILQEKRGMKSVNNQ